MSSVLGFMVQVVGLDEFSAGFMVQVVGLDEFYAVVYGTGGGVGMSSLLGLMVQMVGLV